jgi:hypothetical protein
MSGDQPVNFHVIEVVWDVGISELSHGVASGSSGQSKSRYIQNEVKVNQMFRKCRSCSIQMHEGHAKSRALSMEGY